MTDGPHILIVDDHPDIRDLTAKYVVKNGFRATVADGAAAARRLLSDHAIDLIVLDVMMPGEDGLSLCRHIVESRKIPVILLTAMAEETDRIIGLELGADDYVTKPFNPRELLARIKAVLRRSASLPVDHDATPQTSVQLGPWRFDAERRVLIGEDEVVTALSTGEYKLLTVFLAHPGVVLDRDRLLDLTRGRDAAPFDRSIDNTISRLRKKIEPDPKTPVLIQTVWGGGYRLNKTQNKDLGDA